MDNYGVKWRTDKKEEVFEKQEFNLPIFKLDEKESVFHDGTINDIAIIGENFEALRALLVNYEEGVDFIYIDPPYNTRNRESEFKYNDKRVDDNDGFSHSKWLSFMRNRLWIAKMLLSDDGSIAVSIDSNEVASLKLLMDGIFGEENGNILVWKKKSNPSNTESEIGTITEYILVYKKQRNANPYSKREMWLEGNAEGEEKLETFLKTNKGAYFRKTMLFPITDPLSGKEFFPPEGQRWTIGSAKIKEYLAEGLIVFKNNRVYLKKTMGKSVKTKLFNNLLINVGSLKSAKNEIGQILGDAQIFSTPKPSALILRLIRMLTKKDSIILDFFAGSGTTLQAVKEANMIDNGSRQSIVITNDEGNISKIMLERIKNLDKLKPKKIDEVLYDRDPSSKFTKGDGPTPKEDKIYKDALKEGLKAKFNSSTFKHEVFKQHIIKHKKSSLTVFNVDTYSLKNPLSLKGLKTNNFKDIIGDGPLMVEDGIIKIEKNKLCKIYETKNGKIAIMKDDNPYTLLKVIDDFSPRFIYRPTRDIQGNEHINGATVISVPHDNLLNMRKVADYLDDEKEY